MCWWGPPLLLDEFRDGEPKPAITVWAFDRQYFNVEIRN